MACGQPTGTRDDYDLPLHIGSVFIILFVSASACAFPLLATKIPCLRIPLKFLFAVRHFGTGVLLATAFAHLLPTAFVSLTDPCLPAFWNEDYPAMAGVIALAAVFLVATVEMIFSPGRSCCAPVGLRAPAEADVELQYDKAASSECCSPESPCQTSSRSQCTRPTGPLYGRSGFSRANSISQTLSRMSAVNAQIDRIEESAEPEDSVEPHEPSANKHFPDPNRQEDWAALQDAELARTHREPTPEQKRKKELLQCFLLEVGILFHSIFIGMALAVATGNDFVVLLIAIAFHQTFEGLALGSRIASVGWNSLDSTDVKKPRWQYQPWLMALAYGFTTPIGQVIGIATHTLYTPDSMTGLLMVGVMNAISSGLLTFTSLIDLLSEDFLSDESWRTLRGKRRIGAWASVVAGAFGMSLIGAWA